MKVILNEDITNLGYKFDVVEVKPGYGRNYLIPQGKAKLANEFNLKIHNENMKQKTFKAEKIKEEARQTGERMKQSILRIPAKVGESGKIYGSVTTAQISEVLVAHGFEVDRKQIKLLDDIKTLGTYVAQINLNKDVSLEISFEVIEG